MSNLIQKLTNNSKYINKNEMKDDSSNRLKYIVLNSNKSNECYKPSTSNKTSVVNKIQADKVNINISFPKKIKTIEKDCHYKEMKMITKQPSLIVSIKILNAI